MNPHRFSVATLMIFVVVIAINIAVVRALFAYNKEMLIGVALSGLVLQAGLIEMIRRRGRGRAFWAGFIACDMTAMISFVYAMMFPRIVGYNRSTERFERLPGPPWVSYDNFVFDGIDKPLLRLGVRPGSISIIVIEAVVWSLPQLLIAVVGGLLALLIIGRWVKSPTGDPETSHNATAPQLPHGSV